MVARLIRFIFFGNYFIGLLAIALTIESTLQLKLQFNALPYYILIFCASVVYYTHAYMGATRFSSSSNPRVAWYIKHQHYLRWSQWVLSAVAIISFLYLFIGNLVAILALSWLYWAAVAFILLVAFLYYGLLPAYFFNLNLRNTGWLKPFIIGFIWACTANVLPPMLLKIEHGIPFPFSEFWLWLFVKNWMFCTVNAIMFDIKDYEIDANRELKTFVVQFGIHKTIFFILMPLLAIGMLSLFVFTSYEHIPVKQVLINLVPFILTLVVAFSLNLKKPILYYLIVIDGLILLKALCGITGAII
jgi:4-hydroxybenzoate polyprenyltransferase